MEIWVVVLKDILYVVSESVCNISCNLYCLCCISIILSYANLLHFFLYDLLWFFVICFWFFYFENKSTCTIFVSSGKEKKNLTKSYKNYLQNTQHMVLCNRPTLSIGTERLACLNSPPPRRAAGDPRLARGRSQVRAPGPAGALCALFLSTLPSFLLREIVFFAPSPPTPQSVRAIGHWTTSASSPNFFFQKVEIFIPLDM